MSDEFEYDPQWWKKEKQLSLERKASEAEANAPAQAGDSFLIVTEGTVTEPCYFRALRAALQLTAVKVRVEPGDASDARHVIDTAVRLRAEREHAAKKGTLALDELRGFDQVWAVLDTDVSERLQRWPDIVQYAQVNEVSLAYSTPCVEYWLLLHKRHTTGPLLNGTHAKSVLKEEIGEYSTNEDEAKAAMAALVPHWPTAVTRGRQVRKYHADAATPKPANPSTEVDQLVTALNFAAPPYVRRLKL